jgi:hypothetical protein
MVGAGLFSFVESQALALIEFADFRFRFFNTL